MYKTRKPQNTTLRVNNSYIGETLEQKVNRIVNNKEPIKDGAPLIYTDRKDGVRPEYNIRTDRWELAIDAMEIVAKDKLAKRIDRQKAKELKASGDVKAVINDGEAKSTAGTDQ